MYESYTEVSSTVLTGAILDQIYRKCRIYEFGYDVPTRCYIDMFHKEQVNLQLMTIL